MKWNNSQREGEYVAALADACVARLRQAFELRDKEAYPCCIGCGEFNCYPETEWCPLSLDAVLGSGASETAMYHVDSGIADRLVGNPTEIVERGGADALTLACYQAAAHQHRGKDARVVVDDVAPGIYRPLVILRNEFGEETTEDPLEEAKLAGRPCACGEAHA